MKKYILSLMSVVTLFAMTSCNDEEFGSNTVQPGSLISFSIDQPRTRTVYEAGDQWQIDWLKGDGITIFCQQAEGAKSANYTITPTSDAEHKNKVETPSKYGLVDYNANGLCWNGAIINENPDHNFYAAYPAGVANAVQTENQLSFPLPNSQECKVSGGLQSAQKYQYVAAPDMRYAYMVAAKEGVKAGDIKSSTTDASGTINLVFAPVMTTLDVVVKYEDNNANANPLKVTGITVTLPGVPRVSGNRFRYQLEENTMSTDSTGNKSFLVTGDLTTSTETFFAGVNMVDGKDKTVGNELALEKGQSVKFTVLLPPVSATDMAKAKIRVNASGSVNYTVTLTGTNIKPSSRRQVNLPAIVTPANPQPNNWISQLDDDIYINQLSIPGTNNSAAYKSYNNLATSQTHDLDEQWAAGVRAFEFRTAVADAAGSGNTARKTSCYDAGVNTQTTFENAIDKIYGYVNGTDEFAIVILSYQAEKASGIAGAVNKYWKGFWKANDTETWLFGTQHNYGIPHYIGQNISDHNRKEVATKDETGYFIQFNPELTVGEARGKIILFNMDEFDGYPGALVEDAESNDSEGLANVSDSGVDYRTDGSWHTLTYKTGRKSEYIYLQNATSSNYVDNATKQANIKKADAFACQLHTDKAEHKWVINYVGGAAATNTAGYQESAAANNKFFNDWLISPARPEGPTGIVMVSHQGVQYTEGEEPVAVYGENLPQTIINNNFKFRMQRKNDVTEGQQTGQH